MASDGALLPHEILIDIFKLATDDLTLCADPSITWTPFEAAYAIRSKDTYAEALRTKHSLGLVSTLFRELIVPFLYEHLWLRHGATALLTTLETSKGSDGLGYGRFVRRVTISSSGHCSPHEVMVEVNTKILGCCPFIEHIIRPQEPSAGDQILLNSLDPPYLSRVDWHNTPFDSSFASSPAPRFIFHSRSLRVLILGADNFPWVENIEPEMVIDLPHLHTLGINSSNTFGSEPRQQRLIMPSLQRLIVGRPEAIYNLFSATLDNVARQIRALELGADPRFLRHDFVATLLGYCPSAESLYIPLATTKPIHVNEIPRAILEFASTTSIYLKHASAGSATVSIASVRPDGSVAPNVRIPSSSALSSRRHSDPKVDPKCVRMWSVLHEHFVGLCGSTSRFVNLQDLILCGPEWKETVEDDRFASIIRLVSARGVQMVCEDKKANVLLRKAIKSNNTSLNSEYDRPAL